MSCPFGVKGFLPSQDLLLGKLSIPAADEKIDEGTESG
jgi:hypothetical protein